jgi:hypothetical protein
MKQPRPGRCLRTGHKLIPRRQYVGRCQSHARRSGGIIMRNDAAAVDCRKATSKLIQNEILPMATRVERLAEYTTDREPRRGSKVELLCEDHRGTYVLPFPCHRAEGHGSTPTAMRKFKSKLWASEHGIPTGAAEEAGSAAPDVAETPQQSGISTSWLG